MLSSVILEFCFFPNTHRYVGHLGGFKILVISWRVSLYLYFLLTVLEYNCLRVHVTSFTPTGVSVEGGRKSLSGQRLLSIGSGSKDSRFGGW